MKMDYQTLSIEELNNEKEKVETNYNKLLKLLKKTGTEMDRLSDEYKKIKEEMSKRNG